MSQSYEAPNPIPYPQTPLSDSRVYINGALDALLTHFSGATEPSKKAAYQLWADTTTGRLKMRNAANNAWLNMWPLANPGSPVTRVSAKTASFTADEEEATHYTIDTTAGSVTATLPPAATGLRFTFVKKDSGPNSVTIDGDGSETINGATSLAPFTAQFTSYTVWSDGTEWYIET